MPVTTPIYSMYPSEVLEDTFEYKDSFENGNIWAEHDISFGYTNWTNIPFT